MIFKIDNIALYMRKRARVSKFMSVLLLNELMKKNIFLIRIKLNVLAIA